MSSLRILMCSHDRRGLGHTSRTLAIAARLASDLPECAVLVLTDLSIIGRFKFPNNVDFVRLPGVIEGTDTQLRPGALSLSLERTLKIRRKIIESVAKTFKPHLVVVERDPCMLPKEMKRTLEFVREELPDAKIVWGLPDVVGEPEEVARDWRKAGILDLFDELCDEIWVHGDARLFDHIRNYDFLAPIADKIVHTGYLRPPSVPSSKVSKELAQGPYRPVVLITAGGGSRGYPLIDNYLRFLEHVNGSVRFQSVVVSGPMMGREHKTDLIGRARKLPNVIFHRFSKNLNEYLRQARLVVHTGGYNTHCASLTFRKKSIIAPIATPPNERLKRAQVFGPLGVVDLLRPDELTPSRLGDLVMKSMENGSGYPEHEATRSIRMDGLDRIGERIRQLAGSPGIIVREGGPLRA